MAYKEGSMGIAILVGFITFFALNAILGVLTPVCIDMDPLAAQFGAGAMDLSPVCASALDAQTMLNSMIDIPYGGVGMAPAGLGIDFTTIGLLAGAALIGLGPLFVNGLALNIGGILLAIIAPLVAGVLAGVIARGSASRGFVAGFSSVLIGYFIAFVVFFVYIMALGGSAAVAPGLTMDVLTPLFGALLIIPVVVGILGGIGGAILSAVLASSASAGQASTTTTNIIQTPAPATAPVVVQGGPTTASTTAAAPTAHVPAPAPAAQIKCPACGTVNDPGTTFCQSCGTRLKS